MPEDDTVPPFPLAETPTPERWAEAFVAAVRRDPGLATDPVRVAMWFEDAMSRWGDLCASNQMHDQSGL